MNFFERQAAARRTSRQWVFLFILAVTAIVVAVDTVIAVVVSMYRQHSYAYDDAFTASSTSLAGPIGWTTFFVLAMIVFASLYKSSALRAGGSAVAIAAGGVRIDRNTNDAANKRLLNIVEEMSIASGVPMPEVYVLEKENSINAFAAGHTPANAAIAVTRGALDTLNRDELQGVIAHEFSHLLNGDMRLNIKLMGLLFGILVIALAGRFVLRVAPRGGDRKNGGAIAAVMLAALAIMAIGYIGLFFGRLIQAAVARSRESLADASAVQFTRDTLGLRGALVKIGASEYGSKLRETPADEIAHMLFAPGMWRLFATHPPLITRLRALDPAFRESEFAAMRKKMLEQPAEEREEESKAQPTTREKLDSMVGRASVAPAGIAQLVGSPSTTHIETAQSIFASLPEDVVTAVTSVDSARALFFALALDDDPAAQSRQLNFIATQLGKEIAASVQTWLSQARALQPAQRQPALLRLLPALRQMSEADRAQLLSCLTGLLQREGSISIEKYSLRKLAQLHLRESITIPSLPGRGTLDTCANELALLFSILARAGSESSIEARQAYEAGMGFLLPRSRPEIEATENWSARLDLALNKLDRLLPAAKELLVQALVKTISSDGKLMVQEAELLRAICASVHCPLPPLIQ